MPSGFFALLDDIATLAKAAASSIDDVAAGAMKASAKSAGVVIDDTAVAPQYVQGLSPARELPVIWRISRGSLINKFVIIIPLAMVLSSFAPQVLPWLLVVGGTYLSYEGALKVGAWLGWVDGHGPHRAESDAAHTNATAKEQEDKIVRSAVTTDVVLSTEIMLIAMDNLQEPDVVRRLAMLIIVAIAMTALVYGVVAVLVKLDDVGLRLAEAGSPAVVRFGHGLAQGMPGTFRVISVVGTVAMLWVGGHLFAKALHQIGVSLPHEFVAMMARLGAYAGPVGQWLGDTLASFVVGIVWGALAAVVVFAVGRVFARAKGTH